MEFSEVHTILKDWDILVKEIKKVNYHGSRHLHNVRRAIFLFRELCDYLMEHHSMLKQWMTEYLDKNKDAIFITWWGDQVYQWADNAITSRFYDSYLYVNIEEEWDYMFGADPTTRFKTAHDFAKELIAKNKIEQCDDLTIRAVHDGLPHNGDWWGCDRCDEQERLWKNELERRLHGCNHPLLNKEKRKSLNWHVESDRRSKNLLLWRTSTYPNLEHWSPPHHWGHIYTDSSHYHGHREPCYQLEEYKQSIKKSFDKHKEIKNQTRIQAFSPFLYDAFLGLAIPEYKSYKDPYSAFVFLWNHLELLPFYVELYSGRLHEIEKLF